MKTFGLLGKRLSHSFSPAVHAAFGDPDYRIFETDDPVAFLEYEEFDGLNVTIPYKETMFSAMDVTDDVATRIGAVNTIVRQEGRLIGYNTDGIGLLRDLEAWTTVRGKRFVILGAGGAARAAVYALGLAGAAPIVVNRTEARARELAERFGCPWERMDAIGELSADVLINTTPIGMFPNPERSPLPAGKITRFHGVLDMIYNPMETRLLRDAAAAGCAVHSGLGMFVHQGAEQIRLWMGIEPPLALMRQVVLERLTAHAGN